MSEPTRVLAFTDEHLLAVLPPDPANAALCSTCGPLRGGVSRTERGGEAAPPPLPEAVRRLREFMRLGENVATNWLEVCPECRALFYAERSSEYLVTGSEDCESHHRVTRDEVLKLPEVSWARHPGAELHGFADGTWSIIREPAKRLPQRRS